MAEYSLAHIGINAANEEEARKAAELFCTIFGFELTPGNSSIFAGAGIEVMKEPVLRLIERSRRKDRIKTLGFETLDNQTKWRIFHEGSNFRRTDDPFAAV